MGALFVAVFAIAATLYGVTAVVIYFRQRSLQYTPTHKDAQGNGNKKFKPWKDAQGEFLGYFRPTTDPRRIVLFFHGGSGEALDRDWADELVPERDLLVLAEYPGYGARRGGTISEASLIADSEKLVAEAHRTWGSLPILAVGESLGCAIAARLASTLRVERLALITPFASGEAVAAKHYRYLPVKWMLKDKYRLERHLQTSRVPLHVVHGTLDEYIPLEHGRAVFQAYQGPQKAFDEVPGFGHANIAHAVLHSPFTARFRQFISE